ncbi:MAG TPA: phosphoenolpyruvate--protein phosphotransferase, partial [Gammaproteobacteria bacterium]|nr:phosphoenolpyruvate--protein phosphotransferase [Gammaproteobacteria bacterium]
QYRGVLGVPVVHRQKVLGVLLVRQRKARRFDDADEAVLTTLGAQLGSAIAHAKAIGEWCRLCRPHRQRTISGVPGALGLSMGHAEVIVDGGQLVDIPDRQASNVQVEVERLHAAIRAVRDEASAIRTRFSGQLGETELGLFDAYAMLLDSPELLAAATTEIQRGNWAAGSVARAVEEFAKHFDAIPDAYLRERAADIRALGKRIVGHLLDKTDSTTIGDGPIVLVGQCLSVLDIGKVKRANLVGIVTAEGSAFSHIAIVARALGIPAVVGVQGPPLAYLDGHELVVDGDAGQVHAHLSGAMRAEFARAIDSRRRENASLESIRHLEAVTADGQRATLYVNAGLSADAEIAVTAGASGIGLYRSELPFMLFDRLPSEREQAQLYRAVLQAMHPLPVTIRVLDIGGDKQLPYLQERREPLTRGQRGIRFLLDHPDVFLTQLRAALRANEGLGNLRLLLPMITCVDELDQSLRLVDQAVEQLEGEGVDVRRPEIGVMIEVPAAIYQIALLAKKVAFFSVGTNDLAQFLLATDRDDTSGAARFGLPHPALLQALHRIIEEAHQAGKPVSVCGEIAGDPAVALVLLGMGFDALSMGPAVLPRVKAAIRRVDSASLRNFADEALRCQSRADVERLLSKVARTGAVEGASSTQWEGESVVAAAAKPHPTAVTN